MRLLLAKPAHHVTPIPEEVQEAGKVELAEPWADKVPLFVDKRLTPTDNVAQASSSAEIRSAFLDFAEGALDKREVGMKLFYEKTVMYKSGAKRTSKRVYELAFSGGASLAALVP